MIPVWYLAGGLILILLVFRREILAFRYRNRPAECVRCGNSCRLLVHLTPKDITAVSTHTGQSPETFIEHRFGLPFLRHAPSGHCLFYESQRGIGTCTIYPARPGACRRYPVFTLFGIPLKDSRCTAVKEGKPQAP